MAKPRARRVAVRLSQLVILEQSVAALRGELGERLRVIENDIERIQKYMGVLSQKKGETK